MIIIGYVMSSFIYWSAVTYATGACIWRRRSCCDSCNKTLPWWQLLPIVSFCLLRGRSACCQLLLNKRYPLSELLVVAVMLPVGFNLSASSVLQGSVYLVLIWLSFVDWMSYHIPLPMLLLLSVLLVNLNDRPTVQGVVFTSGVCLLLWISARSAIGSGDIFLFLILGWNLQPIVFLWLIGLSAALALVWTTVQSKRQLIPFVPFISLAYYLMMGGFFDGKFFS